MLMTPSRHTKNEWARFAQDCYRKDHNQLGHRFSTLAALPHNGQIEVRHYDNMQSIYRSWLVFGEFEDLTPEVSVQVTP